MYKPKPVPFVDRVSFIADAIELFEHMWLLGVADAKTVVAYFHMDVVAALADHQFDPLPVAEILHRILEQVAQHTC